MLSHGPTARTGRERVQVSFGRKHGGALETHQPVYYLLSVVLRPTGKGGLRRFFVWTERTAAEYNMPSRSTCFLSGGILYFVLARGER